MSELIRAPTRALGERTSMDVPSQSQTNALHNPPRRGDVDFLKTRLRPRSTRGATPKAVIRHNYY